jgi:hypothetical protein
MIVGVIIHEGTCRKPWFPHLLTSTVLSHSDYYPLQIFYKNKKNNFLSYLILHIYQLLIISLRLYRKTNGADLKTVKQITVPETHAQDEIVKEVIKLYIDSYLKTGHLYYGLEIGGNCYK